MPIFRSDNLDRDIEDFLRSEDKAIERLPRCSECDNPIQDDFCYQINGELICKGCLKEYRVRTEEFCTRGDDEW